jgi:hypothetical protein
MIKGRQAFQSAVLFLYVVLPLTDLQREQDPLPAYGSLQEILFFGFIIHIICLISLF